MSDEKVCSECKVKKSIEEFSKNRSRPDGIRTTCKKCDSTRIFNYRRTKVGLITKMMHSMQGRKARNPGFEPNFSRKELLEWALSQEVYHTLYEDYVNSNYDSNKKPSIDRIDDYKGYTFDNIQLMTWEENFKKSREDMKSGKNNKTGKPIIQLSLEGLVIAEHFSIKSAGRKLGVNHKGISECCNNRQKTAGGFKWKFKHKESVKDKHNLT